MSTPYLSEIKLVAFGYPPKGWAFCNGQLLPINQNQALFALLGTTYGGNGTTNFQLPNLQGRAIIGMGNVTPLGEVTGVESVALTIPQVPNHSHTIGASLNAASSVTPAGMVPAISPPPVGNAYGSTPSPTDVMSSGTVRDAGGNQPHENRMPSLTLNYVIALQGIFPSRN